MRTLMILALLAALCAACADDHVPSDATPAEPTWLTGRPENAHPYADETLVRFRKLVAGAGWRDVGWTTWGVLKAVEERTGVLHVLAPPNKFNRGDGELRLVRPIDD
jgi:hypothetical protein